MIDFDKISREVVAPGSSTLKRLASEFGTEVILTDGTLDRARLGGLCFGNPDRLRKLNGIMRTPMRLLFLKKLLTAFFISGFKVVVVDAPLLFEGGLHRICSSISVVYVDEETQLKRLMERDSISEAVARKKISSQLPLEVKKKMANDLFDNSGSREHLNLQVHAWWTQGVLPLERAYTLRSLTPTILSWVSAAVFCAVLGSAYIIFT